MTTNLFVIPNVNIKRTGGSFIMLLSFFLTSWGVGVLNSAIFNSFHNRVESGTILEGLRKFGGGFEPPKPPSVCHCPARHITYQQPQQDRQFTHNVTLNTFVQPLL